VGLLELLELLVAAAFEQHLAGVDLGGSTLVISPQDPLELLIIIREAWHMKPCSLGNSYSLQLLLAGCVSRFQESGFR